MDSSKGIITFLIFFSAFVSCSCAQVGALDTIPPFETGINTQLIELAEKSNDSIIVGAFLKKKPDYHGKDKEGRNVLETSYYWMNENVFWCIYDYILTQKDTTFIQNSKMLEAAIQNGDTLLADRLLNLFGHKIRTQDRYRYINTIAEFCIGYNISNRYPGIEHNEVSINSVVDIDLWMADIMTRYGFDFNQPDTMGQHILFKCRHLPIVAKYFIEHNIVINKLDNQGRTFLQVFLDDVAKPLYFGSGDFDDYGEIDKFYFRKLELLKYYIEIGASVGENKIDGWKYLVEVLKNNSNPYLKKYLSEHYTPYIK